MRTLTPCLTSAVEVMLSMKGKFILISGSASHSCPVEKLDRAIDFVQCFVTEVLRLGGGVVVLGSDESASLGSHDRPRIFDWVVLREVKRYVESTTKPPRTLAKLVMSDQAVETKFDDRNFEIFSKLAQRGVLEVERIRREEYTGGRYRQLELELADAMIAIGGGKGTYISGTDMLEAGKPVLPLDLKIGASSEDGEGAILLLRELTRDPARFFQSTEAEVIDKIDTLSLDRGIHQPSVVAQRAVEILSLELGQSEPLQRTAIRRLIGSVDKVVGKFVTWVGLIRAIDFLKGL